MKEKAVETQIKSYIRMLGGYVVKVQSGALMKSYKRKSGLSQAYRIQLADEGTPDLLACIHGKFIAIEVKKDEKEIEKWERTKDTDRRSAAQHNQQEAIRYSGGVTLVVCSVEQLEADLRELGLFD